MSRKTRSMVGWDATPHLYQKKDKWKMFAGREPAICPACFKTYRTNAAARGCCRED